MTKANRTVAEHLQQAARYPQEHLVMVLDGAGWHRSGKIQLPNNLRWLPLPPYAPEFNPVEHLWDDLREKHFHNRVFDSIGALEHLLERALLAWNMKTILNASHPLPDSLG